MKLTYTLIAYKRDSSDSCRGCHMASYESDHVAMVNLDRDRLIQEWGILKAREYKINESSFDISILACIGGYNIPIIWGDVQDCWREEFPDEIFYSDEFAAAQTDIQEIERSANEEIAKIKQKEADERMAAQKKEILRQEQWRKDQEIAEFKRLQEKYGKGTLGNGQ